MKKTAIAIAMMTLILIGTTVAQPARRIAGSTAMGGGSGVGVKNRQTANLGDTATHEVGHKGKRRNGQFRPNPTGDGTTQHFRKNGRSGQHNRSRHPQATNSSYFKPEGIDGESVNRRPTSFVSPSSDPHGKNPTARRKTQNLLPYMEQSNLKVQPRSKPFGAGNQVEAKTKANGNQ